MDELFYFLYSFIKLFSFTIVVKSMYRWLSHLFCVRDAAFASSYLITRDYFIYRPR